MWIRIIGETIAKGTDIERDFELSVAGPIGLGDRFRTDCGHIFWKDFTCDMWCVERSNGRQMIRNGHIDVAQEQHQLHPANCCE